MTHYFLREDYEKLLDSIAEAHRRVKHFGREMGLSCQEGAETFHDNFAYEDGERNLKMWSRQLKLLIDLRDQARVVAPEDRGDRVALGRSVTLLDLETRKQRTFRIGSYMIFGDPDGAISYTSPLAQSLIGALEGELRSGELGGELRCFKVVAVE
jgi:transcription elongation GreA/GreB family factor